MLKVAELLVSGAEKTKTKQGKWARKKRQKADKAGGLVIKSKQKESMGEYSPF